MAKNCLIYETLGPVSNLKVEKSGKEGLISLSGVFGVCGVRNNNKRVYEASNYGKRVSELQQLIKENGGIPGELEHPQNMNITLENVSHKITDIRIDEQGVISGTIVLLNTPKGQIAQAIVEGGLPLFISSRATGSIGKDGAVVLEKISTYDLVGTPGFSQARLHLNENQVAECLNESVYMVYENSEENNELDEDMNEALLERLEALEERLESLETENQELREALEEAEDKKSSLNESQIKTLANAIQNWVIEEFAPSIQGWIEDEFTPELNESIEEKIEDAAESTISKAVKESKNWVIDECAPNIQNWVIEEFAPEVETWAKSEFAGGIQNWIIEEFAPEVETWLNESYSQKIQNNINEAVEEYKSDKLNSIDATLNLLESIEMPSKKDYKSNVQIVENMNEPAFIREMPMEARVKWESASQEVKESINRRAKLYNFSNAGSIERFWENVDFSSIKPANAIYENLNPTMDENERAIRASLRKFRMRRLQ